MEDNNTNDHKLNAYRKLMDVQKNLNVPKGRFNKFGNFYSRSKEDIIEAVKPLLFERNMVLLCHDDTEFIEETGWTYATSSVTIVDLDSGYEISATGRAREPETKPKMDVSQVTGSACSYAGKRALGNLFAIDDSLDADQIEVEDDGPFVAACTACGLQYQFESHQQMESCACQCGNNKFKAV